MTKEEREQIERLADAALEKQIYETGSGFLERPYSRYRFHNGFLAGAEALASMRENQIAKDMATHGFAVQRIAPADIFDQPKPAVDSASLNQNSDPATCPYCKEVFGIPKPAVGDESSGDFLNRLGMDGKLWAEEFVKRFDGHVVGENDTIDVDTMLGWFCNAIMAGYDRARTKYEPKPAVGDDIKSDQQNVDIKSDQQDVDIKRYEFPEALAIEVTINNQWAIECDDCGSLMPDTKAFVRGGRWAWSLARSRQNARVAELVEAAKKVLDIDREYHADKGTSPYVFQHWQREAHARKQNLAEALQKFEEAK